MFSPVVQPARPLPLTPIQRRLGLWGAFALAVWLFSVVFGAGLLAHSGLALNAHGHAHVYAHGHPFVDARSWLGLPNAMDVLSNLPLLIAGIWGLRGLGKAQPGEMPAHSREALSVFFWGLALAGVGSSMYHWAPAAQTLVWDRLGMAVTFAGALGLAMGERVSPWAARPVVLGVLALGCVSAALPLVEGNVLPWVVVQFGGMGFLVWASLRRPLLGALGVSLGGLIALYALAKAFELGDATVFHATGDLISGHSLKHLIAALAAWPVVRAMRQNAHTSAKSAGQ